MNIPKPTFFPMATKSLDPNMSVIKSFDNHPSVVKIKLKRLTQPFISEKLAVKKLKRLLVISTLKCLANKKIFPLRSVN